MTVARMLAQDEIAAARICGLRLRPCGVIALLGAAIEREAGEDVAHLNRE
jgi:hypothetical protein